MAKVKDESKAAAKATKAKGTNNSSIEYKFDPEYSLVDEEEFHLMAKNEKPRVCPRCHVTYPRCDG